MTTTSTELTLTEDPQELRKRRGTSDDFAASFWSRVDQSSGPDACWPWTGGKFDTGYGCVWFEGRAQKAHRVAWQLVHGPVGPDERVLHHCDNPPCCNPYGLVPGMRADDLTSDEQRVAALREAILTADDRLNKRGDPIAAHIYLVEAIEADDKAAADDLTPEQMARLDETLAEWGAHRNQVIAKTIDFLERVQEYARETLRRDGAPGPLEKEANTVGALLRAEFPKKAIR